MSRAHDVAHAPALTLMLALALAVALAVASTPHCEAALLPDPGGPSAWGAGLALLADAPGPLALFDQPARLIGSPLERGLAFAASRARWFELDALTRVRVAGRWRGPGIALAVGGERFGPPEARQSRASIAAAARVRALDVGAAWHEARGAGALDAGLVATSAAGDVACALAARALAAGGDARARPEPDWTLEGAWRRGEAILHAALTRDLVSTRAGGGLVLRKGVLSVGAGAFGAPWTWALAVSWRGRGIAGGYARAVHPALGVCEQWEGGIAW